MQVKMGNPSPTTTNIADRVEPTVETMTVPDTYTYVVADSAADLANDVAGHIGRSVDGITRLPDQEALLSVIAAWRAQSTGNPTWVWSDNDEFAVLLSNFFAAPLGVPDDVEDTHHTDAGPPGVGPAVGEPDATATEATP